MTESRTLQLARIRLHVYSPPADERFDLEGLASLGDVHPVLIRQYVQLGLLDPVAGDSGPAWQFDDRSLYVLRKIQRLRRELGVNVNGVGIILELQRQIEDLQGELAMARGR